MIYVENGWNHFIFVAIRYGLTDNKRLWKQNGGQRKLKYYRFIQYANV